MNTKVHVENLATATTENELVDLFSAYGNVVSVSIAVDRTSHKPLGFGFVTMVTPQGARAAIEALNGKTIGTCTLAVSEESLSEEYAGPANGRRSPRRRASQLY